MKRRRERRPARSQGVLFYHTRDVVLSRARFCISEAPRNLGLGALSRIAIISSLLPRLPFSATYASPIAHPLLQPPSPSPSPHRRTRPRDVLDGQRRVIRRRRLSSSFSSSPAIASSCYPSERELLIAISSSELGVRLSLSLAAFDRPSGHKTRQALEVQSPPNIELLVVYV
jgi:hypothetical protein